MDAILGDVNDIISDMKADHRVVNAIVRTNARDNDVITAWAQVEFLQLLFHGSPIKAVVGVFFDDDLIEERFELFDERDGGSVVDERVLFAEESELRMVFGSDRLNVNDPSVSLAKSIQQGSDLNDYRFDSGAMPFTAFGLHVDDDESGAARRKLGGWFRHKDLQNN